MLENVAQFVNIGVVVTFAMQNDCFLWYIMVLGAEGGISLNNFMVSSGLLAASG